MKVALYTGRHEIVDEEGNDLPEQMVGGTLVINEGDILYLDVPHVEYIPENDYPLPKRIKIKKIDTTKRSIIRIDVIELDSVDAYNTTKKKFEESIIYNFTHWRYYGDRDYESLSASNNRFEEIE